LPRSMTGFGTASVEGAGLRAVVEARSVNNRYLKVVVKAPATLSGRVPALEGLVRERLRRGTVTVTLHVDFESRPPAYALNPAALRAHHEALTEAAESAGIPGELTLRDLSGLPGVFEPVDVEPSLEEEKWASIRAAVVESLDALVETREREGLALRDEFLTRKRIIEEHLEGVRERAPVVVSEYRTRLVERLETVLAEHGATVTPEDILKEAAIFADRADITEELARLGSHLEEYDRVIEAGGELGRRLEFILQEMLREANTVGAKANDYEISDRIVQVKTEIEKLKEQVQNLE
jgi:uncharacterized protein (TIGR00255 family)